MADNFNPAEILRIAVNVEKNGKELYAMLQAKATNEKAKKVWKYLKVAESKHIEIFQNILDKINDYIAVDYSPGQYEAYLRAIASEYIVNQEVLGNLTAEDFKNDLDAIDFGIKLEKESILVYSELRNYILTEMQGVIDKLIVEEKQHLADLVELKRFMSN